MSPTFKYLLSTIFQSPEESTVVFWFFPSGKVTVISEPAIPLPVTYLSLFDTT